MAILCSILIVTSPFLREAWGGLMSRPTSNLDERERLALAQAQAKAYAVLALVILVAPVYADNALDFGWWLPKSGDDWHALKFPVFAMVASLPIVIAEWTVPLPPADEAD